MRVKANGEWLKIAIESAATTHLLSVRPFLGGRVLILRSRLSWQHQSVRLPYFNIEGRSPPTIAQKNSRYHRLPQLG